MMILRITTRIVLAVALCYGSAAVLQHAVIGLDGAMMRQQVQHTAGPSANPAKDCYPCGLSRGKIQGGQIACKVIVQNHTRAQLAELTWLLWFCCFAENQSCDCLTAVHQRDQRQD